MAVIEAPVAGFSGTRAGVTFKDGRAETSNPDAIAYFRRHGYTVNGVGADSEPEPADPRDIGDGTGVEPLGTKLRDAAVDPRPDDFLPPTNAGEANPHGPDVISPQIHAAEQGAKPIVAGPVSSDADVQAAKETEAVVVAVTDGPGEASSVQPRPATSALKGDWETYAVAHGYDVAEGLTKDQLIDRYGGDT